MSSDRLAAKRRELERRLAELSASERAAFDKTLDTRGPMQSAAVSQSAHIPVREPSEPVPMSYAQELLWLLERTSPGHAYNVPRIFRLQGPLDIGALQEAANALVARHEALRTTFEVVDQQPYQIVNPPGAVQIDRWDFSQLPEAERTVNATARLVDFARKPFDLATDLQLRMSVIRLGDDDHVLAVVSHHISTDGWSGEILLRELGALYGGIAMQAEATLDELPVQYPDFAAWQRRTLSGERLRALVQWWRDQLSGAAPTLDLPTIRASGASKDFDGATRSHVMSRDLLDSLRRFATAQGVTEFTVLLATLQMLLARYSGEEEFVVGTPVAGRAAPELDGVVGFFSNTLLLRASLAGEPTFGQFVTRVRDRYLDAFDHQDVPLEALLLDRTPEAEPIIVPQVVFTMGEPGRKSFELPGTRTAPFSVARGAAKFDLALHAQDVPAGLRLHATFRTGVFAPEMVEQMLHGWGALLTAALAAPDTCIHDLPVPTSEDDENPTESPAAASAYPPTCLHRRFEAQAARTPEAVAVTCDGQALTYAELNRRANRLAHALQGRGGIAPGVLVGLCVERSLDLVIGILGILKAGAAYLPLDPSYPAERIEFMLDDAEVPVVVTQQSLRERFEGRSIATLLVDLSEVPPHDTSAANATSDTTPDDLAYVIYTSGSTGRPKGVQISHGNVSRLFDATEPWFGFGPTDVWTLFHSYAFDFSVWEIWGALLHGGKVVVVPYGVSRSPTALADLLVAEAVTVLNQTPSAFYELIDAATSGTQAFALRYVIFGGEALEPARLRPWVARFGVERPRLINMYGITETTVHVTYRPLTSQDIDNGAISVIGRPIPDLSVTLRDARGRPVPRGVAGEMFVGGAGVARGYLNRPELTAERFVCDPRAADPAARQYRSGDRARLLADGSLEYLGRNDHQVKLRGHRIELGEVEAALMREYGVAGATALVREDSAGDQRLVAYVVAAPGLHLDAAELRTRIRKILPDVMVPSAVVLIERFPLTANGKLDRKALPAPPSDSRTVARRFIAPRTALETEIAQLWSAALHVEAVGIDDDFFELGGSSLLAMRMIAEVERTWGRRLSFQAFFEQPTVERTAEALLSTARLDEAAGFVTLQADGPGNPLFFAHGDVLGYGWYCRRLAPLLGDAPMVVLPTLGPTHVPGAVSTEEMAAIHVRVLKQLRPTGPYRIGGFCHGGIVAYEMARQLAAAGDHVERVLLVDAFCSNLRWRTFEPAIRLLTRGGDATAVVSRRAALLSSLNYYLHRVRQMRHRSVGEQLRWLGGVIRRKLGIGSAPVPTALDRGEDDLAVGQDVAAAEAEARRLFSHVARAQRGYMPGRYEGRVDLIWASGALERRPWMGATGGWERVTRNVRRHGVDATHEGLVGAAGLPGLASAMRAALADE